MPREFTVILRAVGAVRCAGRPFLRLEWLQDNRWVVVRPFEVDEGHEVAVRRGIHLQIHGAADSLECARAVFPAVGVGVAALVGFATNAFAGDPLFLSVYECTPGENEREFHQRLLPTSTGMPPQGRTLPLVSTGKLFQAAMDHPDGGERIGRTIGQYHQALYYWRPGNEILSLAHLYMAVEAMTPLVLRRLLASTGLTKQELATKQGFDVKSPGWQHQLDGFVRQTEIFQGDGATFKAAKEASDGFEHGYLPFSDIRAIASQEVRAKVARYVRSCVLNLLALEPAVRDELLDGDCATPLESWDVTVAVGGALVGKPSDDPLHNLGLDLPMLQYRPQITGAKDAANGRTTYSQSIEAAVLGVPKELNLRLDRYEVLGPNGVTMESFEEPTVTRKPEA